jgi:low affinity Fe/Cu permease
MMRLPRLAVSPRPHEGTDVLLVLEPAGLPGIDRGFHRSHDRVAVVVRNAPVLESDLRLWTECGRQLTMPDRTDAKQPKHGRDFSKLFGEIANGTAHAAGKALTFVIAAAVVLVWAITGPLFQFSDTWQLVINTGTTIVTFLMVFLIQNSQNRDSAAIQVKLDELIRVSTAKNSFVGIEHLTDEELEEIRSKCERRAEAEKAGEASVERTGKKARQAADSAVG